MTGGIETVSKTPWASVLSMRGFPRKGLFQIGLGYFTWYLYPVPYALKASDSLLISIFLNRNHTHKNTYVSVSNT